MKTLTLPEWIEFTNRVHARANKLVASRREQAFALARSVGIHQEFQQHTSRGPNQNGGVAGVPNWVLELPDRTERDVYATEKPAPVICEWKAYGKTGEGKARDLNAARSCAVWPDATDEQLSVEKSELESALMDRLPGLMAEFKTAVESLGFTY